MIKFLRQWYERHFTDPQVVILALLLIGFFSVVIFAGGVLAPVLAGIVIAYLLDAAVEWLRCLRIPRTIAVVVVFTVSFAAVIVGFVSLIPLLSQQITRFFRELPTMLSQGQEVLMTLPEHYPQFVSEQQIQDLIGQLRIEFGTLGQKFVSLSLASVPGLISLIVYAVLVPLLVFFFLKDKHVILAWFVQFLPRERGLASEVWREVNGKIGSYVRGKFIEILIVWSAAYVMFTVFGVEYAALLSVITGLSVIIPFIGAIIASVPVILVAYFQWGLSEHLFYVTLAYMILQFLDGNVLVPLLFSEVVNLHPVAIILAVLLFGSVWGLWGVFFAIPLATLVHAVIRAWPVQHSIEGGEDSSARP